jgi:ABC-type multidrug transport system fused ATPase/permease subunit
MEKTIVTIAHQFSSAKRPDQTLALEGGEIMEWGPMANALTRGAIPNYCNGRAGREPPSMA